MLLRVFTLLTLFIMALPHVAQARAQDNVICPDADYIPVHVTPRFDQPAYDLTKSIAAIDAMAHGSDGQGIHEELTMGLTRYAPMLEVSMPIKGYKMPNGTICGHIDHVDVTVGYKDVVIYIAHEVGQKTCGFNEIMAHEFKHIGVNRDILNAYMPRIQSALENYVRAHGTLRNETQDYALQHMHDDLQNVIENQMDRLESDNQRLQQQVDTPQEYQRITDSCHGELATLTLGYVNRH